MGKKKRKLVTTKYEIISENLPPCRIGLVADLHERDGREVIEILRREQPDLILAAGDILERCNPQESEYTVQMINEWQGYVNDGSLQYKFIRFLIHAGDILHVRDKKYHGGMDFFRQISDIAPVYYSVGNHEWYFYPEDLEFFHEMGIELLDNRYVSCEIKGQKILIGGLSTRHNLDWLARFSEQNEPKILICHHPEYYKKYIRGTERDTFDLIVSGHVHGGQWRFGKKGVLAPGQGFFPDFVYGVYDEKLVISAGLSNTASVPRFGNPMEVVMIEIKQGKNTQKTI